MTNWLDEFFAAYHASRPVNATFIGNHEYDHRLPDVSPNGMADAVATMQDLLRRAPPDDSTPSALSMVGPPAQPASIAASMDVRLACGFLRTQLHEFESHHFLCGNPSAYTGEAAFGVLSLFLTDYAPFAQRLEAAVARLHEMPAFFDAARHNINAAPAAWTDRAIRECDGILAFLTEGTGLLLATHGADASSSARSALERAARVAGGAVAAFRSWLDTDLRRHAVDRHAAGEEALSLYLRDGHFIDQSADEIAAYAESEMAAAAARLATAASDLGAADSREALNRLANLHPALDAYPACYAAVRQRMRDVAVRNDLLTWPDFPIRYVPRPHWVRSAAPYLYFLFYRSPAAMHRPAVHEYLVTPIDGNMPPEEQDRLLRATNDSVIKLNHVIHHGGIGHHVQNARAFEAALRIGRVAAVDCASRIAMFCGGTMAEGWACYATDLMAEFGALSNLEVIAELNGRVRMCARAIVDVRLHQGRFTLEQAAGFYEQHAAMPAEAAYAEAVKNSMFPGTALMYLAGRDAIHRLRRELESIQGGAFRLREFHDTFLSYGSVPVSMIAEIMKRTAAREARP